jgi:hypothetical protein
MPTLWGGPLWEPGINSWYALLEQFFVGAYGTTMHGLVKAFEKGSGKVRSMFWAVWFCLGLVAWSYLSSSTIMSYVKEATTTSFIQEYVNHVEGLKMPAFTFCNTNNIDCRCKLWYDVEILETFQTPSPMEYWCDDPKSYMDDARDLCIAQGVLKGQCDAKLFECMSDATAGKDACWIVVSANVTIQLAPLAEKLREWIEVNAQACSQKTNLKKLYMSGNVTLKDIFDYGGFTSDIATAVNRTISAGNTSGGPVMPFVLQCKYTEGLGDIDCGMNKRPDLWKEFLYLGPDNLTFTGWCATFNGIGAKKPISQHKGGNQNGLSITLATNLAHAKHALLNPAVLMSIHNNTGPPNMATAILLAPGQLSLVPIQRTSVSRLGEPYCDCTPPNCKLGERPCCDKGQVGLTSVAACIERCEEKFYNQCCNTDWQRCPMKNLLGCASIDNATARQGLRQRCSDKCLQPCSEENYEANVMSSSLALSKKRQRKTSVPKCLSNYNKLPEIAQLECFDRVADYYAAQPDNLVIANLYYAQLVENKITESPAATKSALFGTLGGNLGLFTGMSFMTLTEVAELALVGILMQVAVCFTCCLKSQVQEDEDGHVGKGGPSENDQV